MQAFVMLLLRNSSMNEKLVQLFVLFQIQLMIFLSISHVVHVISVSAMLCKLVIDTRFFAHCSDPFGKHSAGDITE